LRVVIVCQCRAVSDRILRASIREGATTVDALREVTGASDCCGGCEPLVTEILDQELGHEGTGSSVRPTAFRPLRIARDPRAA
jgi:NAD(P)H-nitrite reductase large subunit